MRLRKRPHLYGIDINIAPLIDVVFLLIIFFMVVSQFTQMEIEALELPQATQGDRPGQPLDRQVILNVFADGRLMIAGQPYDHQQLTWLLQRKTRRIPAGEISVLIRADRATPWRQVRELLQLCAAQSIQHVRVAVLDADSEDL
ncbi:MAG: biopolymer transporter ExbD [Sedimentisphaerales bacterium]|nr:biopolymer transporter ExbD [Sedimentisphaerales bacterium]